MPNYDVFYCMIKPTNIPAGAGVSGSTTGVTPTVPSVAVRRASVLSQFETVLQSLMQSSVAHIPTAGGRSWTVRVRRIPTTAAGMPNYSGLTIHMREPIVYLTASGDDSGTNVPAVRQRPSLRMVRALADYNRVFSSSVRSTARQNLLDTTNSEVGRFIAFSMHAPVVAEVYSHVNSGGATNWIEIHANLMAKVAFHEIAHCKAECTNRRVPSSAGSRHWQAAISGSIHSVSGVGICGASIAFHTTPTTADYRLMGRHMLCPIRFYKHNVAISGQFFTNGSATTLQTDAQHTAAQPRPAPRPAVDPDGLDFLDL